MSGLIFLVIGVADENTGESVKGEVSIGFGVVNGRALSNRFEGFVICFGVVQCPGKVSAQYKLFNASHHCAYQATSLKPLLEVSCFIQLFVKPRGLKRFRISVKLIVLSPLSKGFEGGLGCEHARFNRSMTAFDARCI